MASQPTVRAQFPTPQINKQSTLNSVAVQGATQQLQMQQMQQAVQRPGGGLSQSAMQMPIFSGLTQQQILSQHLQPQPQAQAQRQQPVPQQHQMQNPNMLAQAPLGVSAQSQSGHQQLTQSLNVTPNQVGSSMAVQQQPVLPGRFRITLYVCVERVCPEIIDKMYSMLSWVKGYKNSPYYCNPSIEAYGQFFVKALL